MEYYHLIAIGGSIMHNLALELKNQGNRVAGSDDAIYEPALSNLKNAGILPEQTGWYPEKLAGKPEIILGMHARKDNPELMTAQKLGLKISSFPEFVTSKTQYAKRVVIAGSHGKTTTTSMVLHVLNILSMETDFLVGAQLPGFERMVRLRNAPIAVFEGDEYLSSALDIRPKFVHYKPHIAVITGIAWDHMNVFPTFELYLKAFTDFINSLPKEAVLILCAHDKHLKAMAGSIRNDIKTIWYYAFPGTPDGLGMKITFNDMTYRFPFFGDFNLQNMAAAYKVCKLLGVNSARFFEAMQSFTGASKRLDCLYHDDQLVVYRDFAHAPSKVNAAVKAFRGQFPTKSLNVVVELHTFSSLNKTFIPHYAGCLNGADKAIVVYDPEAMAIKKMPSLHEKDLQAAFRYEHLKIASSLEKLIAQMKDFETQNAVWVFMSSGGLFGFDIKQYVAKHLNPANS